LFANLREMAGAARVSVDADTVGGVLAALEQQYGDRFAAAMATAKVWVNGDEVVPDQPVNPSDEVALIPPVSGGAYTQSSLGGFEPIIVAAGVIALLASNLFFDTVSVMVALVVGLVGLWAIDLSQSTEARGLPLDAWPILSSALIGAIAATGLGPAGMGVAVAFAAIGGLGWTVMHAESRYLTSVGGAVVASVLAAASTASLTLTRLSTSGDDKIAAFVVMAAASILVTWVVGAMRRPILDPFTAGALAAVLAAVGIAALTDLDLIAMFLTGIVVAVSLIAGRGLGAAFRTGEVYLAERGAGTVAVLDGAVLAAAIYFPFLRFVG
jgi:molybdopterin converting factor small subunit